MIRDPAVARHECDRQAGFTLVEVLVALAVFSVIVILLFDNVRFGLRVWQNGNVNSVQLQQSLLSQDLLRRTIGSIYPMVVKDGVAQQQIDFEGSKELMEFLGNAPIVANRGGRFRFRIFVKRRGGLANLVMTSRPELAGPQDTPMATESLLLPDVTQTEFSYFGSLSPGREFQWNDSWTKRSDMPRLIRIRVEFRSGDKRLWPELLIAPHILADVGCVYDPVTMRCRGR